MALSVTTLLIGITCVISLIALYGNEKIYELGMLRPYRTVRKNSWYEVISSGFLHGSLAHLLVNMFVLFFFGSVMEQVLGVFHFIALYISGLAVSSIPSFLFHRDNPNYATIGASGAVYSIYEGQRGSMKINHEAHIAGAVWGILYLLFFVPNSLDHILTVFGLL
ncbi:MAG: rhomboid family intramembrane serine protease [Bacteroidetes bacterium]|jgi:membrane associated rhomboid family serine protease|nr:rhomboid family intramembrane serine protease [Bacteroidota bacterium]